MVGRSARVGVARGSRRHPHLVGAESVKFFVHVLSSVGGRRCAPPAFGPQRLAPAVGKGRRRVSERPGTRGVGGAAAPVLANRGPSPRRDSHAVVGTGQSVAPTTAPHGVALDDRPAETFEDFGTDTPRCWGSACMDQKVTTPGIGASAVVQQAGWCSQEFANRGSTRLRPVPPRTAAGPLNVGRVSVTATPRLVGCVHGFLNVGSVPSSAR